MLAEHDWNVLTTMNNKRPLTRSARMTLVILRRSRELELGSQGENLQSRAQYISTQAYEDWETQSQSGSVESVHELPDSAQPAYPNLQKPIKPKKLLDQQISRLPSYLLQTSESLPKPSAA